MQLQNIRNRGGCKLFLFPVISTVPAALCRVCCKVLLPIPAGTEVFLRVYIARLKSFVPTDCICVPDEIVFFAEDGLYSFNGSSVKRLTFGFEKLVKSNKQKPSATYFNDVYYLALKLDFDDEMKIHSVQ